MQAQLSKKALILSVVVSILATIVSAGGLTIKNLYSDNAFVKSAWHSNDIITLFNAEKTPVKCVSIYLLFVAVMLFIAESGMIIPFFISGIIPGTIKQTGHHTSEIFALDFSTVIPVSIIAAILLWQRRSWGFVTGIMMLVKGFTYGPVLYLNILLLAFSNAYVKWDPLMPLYIIVAAGGLSGCWLLLKYFKDIHTINN